MEMIKVAASAGLDIVKRVASGELEVHGIILRDRVGKKFRYILNGIENLPAGAGPGVSPALDALRGAMTATQALQLVAIAQNASMAATLRRIERHLAAIDKRLDGIEGRLRRIETQLTLILEALHSAPLNRLKAAKAAATAALRHHERGALIAAAKDAQQATLDLMEQAMHLVRVKEKGVPAALLMPVEHADLAESAVEAAIVASAIWLALEQPTQAANLLHAVETSLHDARRNLAASVSDPDFLMRGIRAGIAADADLMAAGERLGRAMHWAGGRALLIDQGVITGDPERIEFEKSRPADGLVFIPVVAERGEATP
jgi:hypothetical protein